MTTQKRTFIAKGYDGGADENGTRPLVTSVRVEYGPGHDRVRIWNRGGCAGELVVNRGDGNKVLVRLLPEYAEHIGRQIETVPFSLDGSAVHWQKGGPMGLDPLDDDGALDRLVADHVAKNEIIE